ncbi:T7SS effector LXG polymorphic toxin [Bacillus atrophaeus]|uniref:T7SS effector LXG polymorphic toxin n=1 Tax=Bacillus atrophaeus TaxID=1452 RepID=UPI003EB892F0
MHHLAKQKQKLEKLEKSVEHMKDALKGKGGDAIRTFYEECHKSFFAFLRHVYRRIQKSAETNAASDFLCRIRFPWLDCGGFSTHDARHGIKHTREVTEQLTDAVNRQTSTIDHIVSLPTVNDAFFRMETEQAEWLITDTLHKLFNSKYTVKELLEEFLEDVKQIVLN